MPAHRMNMRMIKDVLRLKFDTPGWSESQFVEADPGMSELFDGTRPSTHRWYLVVLNGVDGRYFSPAVVLSVGHSAELAALRTSRIAGLRARCAA